MAVSFWALLEALLLFFNAIAVLNEQRFLAKIGWSHQQQQSGYGVDSTTAKARVMLLIHDVRKYMRIPLILLNVCVISLKIVLG
ncbi:hypothetical protein CAOG_08634 [Capsaspora owczarzaki ATCC 30864]|uniref:Immediate early response 3-interacting protein 1 n=1 Tax=Capsaspora owczarzaki (strain ATCC 30864) TaxID=595528 RepID=A0A0D2WN28_CAPO3|nr:hypothetical protein CAOG_08634 [Capsaspora owczarzaki ATCC 30864]KJE91713.1 hypothetical protein CAOG_008634 [Capsaspora owczarzaki ATCC 30864]|eukprot:XP_011270245.1 hypothetical protein CAOG_08634 [Capsaspora owczarzaki ATCC 30864]